MVIFLLECEYEERQANFHSKEVFKSTLEMMASFGDGAVLMEI